MIKVARIFNTDGPNMHPSDGRVISNFVMQALRNEPITIYGDGSQTRSLCYVDDLIEGLVRLMESPPEVTGPINLGNPHELSIAEIARTIIKLTGSKSELVFQPLPEDDPRQRRPDIAHATSVLGWRPHTALHDGLSKTIEYFRAIVRGNHTHVPAPRPA